MWGSYGGGPDYGSMFAAMQASQAAQQQYKLGKEQLQWSKDTFNQMWPYIQQGTEQSLAAQKQANEFATQQMADYNEYYRPLEQKYVDQVQNWDTPESERAQAGMAQEMVASQFNQARSAALQQLEGFGVDPTSTRYAALDLGSRTQQAAAAAGAGTAAIQNRQMQGMQLEAGAINTGRGYANSIPGTMGVAGQLGSAAAGGATNLYGTGANAMNGASAFFNAGNNALGTAAGAYNNFYDNSYPQQSGSSGFGAALGGGLALAGALIPKFEDGGAVGGPMEALPTIATGSRVPESASPSNGEHVDDIPARLAAGEFVIPREVVRWMGEKAVYGMIAKAQQERQKTEQETTTKPSALPALPGPATYHSPGAAQQRAALPV